MTPKERAAMQQALYELAKLSHFAMTKFNDADYESHKKAIAALREALEQPVSQEPVICTECGQPTMHEGSKCYACCQKDTRELENALKASTPQPVSQEPVAWWNGKETAWFEHELCGYPAPDGCTVPLYTAPHPVTEVELTDDDLRVCFKATNTSEPLAEGWSGLERFARAVIAAHKEKNK